MMKFIDSNGNAIMYDEQGLPVTVLTVRNGIMYRISGKTQKSITVTVDLGANGLIDTWVFFQEKTIPMHTIQTRDIIQTLADVYKGFILNTNDYSIEDFITRLVYQYFIGVLNYTLKPVSKTVELNK